MSGGSWDYVCYKIEEAAERLRESKDPLRRALGDHMNLIAKAMHDIEWVDSGDYGKDGDREAIQAIFGQDWHKVEMVELIDEADLVLYRLRCTMEEAKKQLGEESA